MMTYLCGDPEQAEANWARVQHIYAQVHETGVTAEELRQAQSKFSSRIVLGSERPRGRLFVVGSNWLYRQEYRSIQEDLAAVRSITVEDCERFLKKYNLLKTTTYAVGPLDKFQA